MTSEPKEGQILLYTTPDGQVEIDVYFADATVWLSQKKMAELKHIEFNFPTYI